MSAHFFPRISSDPKTIHQTNHFETSHSLYATKAHGRDQLFGNFESFCIYIDDGVRCTAHTKKPFSFEF